MTHRAVAAAVLGLTIHAYAGPHFTFTRLVDRTTPVPGGQGTFSSTGAATISSGYIGFVGNWQSEPPISGTGVYVVDPANQIRAVADGLTPFPGGIGNVVNVSIPTLDGPRGSFTIFGINDQQCVVEYDEFNNLTVIAPRGVTPPGGTPLAHYFTVARSALGSAFVGIDGANRRYVCSTVGGLHIVASPNTPIPGGTGTFRSMGFNLSQYAGEVAFVGDGSGGQTGVYAGTAGNLRVIADASTPIPGALSLTFNKFADQPAIHHGAVLVHAGVMGPAPNPYIHEGLYKRINGLKLVADVHTPIPGGSGIFTRFGSLVTGYQGHSISNGTVVFYGEGAGGQRGVYTDAGGVLSKVVAAGDMLDGEPVTTAGLAVPAIDGNTIAVFVGFTSGGAIYRVQFHACRPDVNDDDRLNVGDLVAFLSLFAGSSPRADFNDDGILNVNDFVSYLTSFAAGCD